MVVVSIHADTLLDSGYRQMYNLDFQEAHKSFHEWQQLHPDDPLGPVSDAAAYLFSELERLNVLEAEFFADDNQFVSRPKLKPDPAVQGAFTAALDQGNRLAQKILSRDPQNSNALFAAILELGLRSDYLALIEKRYLASLSFMKKSRLLAEKLLSLDPSFCDAYLAVGVENYMLSLKAAPLRWLLQMGGAETDKGKGIQKLRLTADKGRFLQPFARLLLAVAALRDKDKRSARDLLAGLAREFPRNRLYAKELARLQ